jgi:diguanylate cyclase (GGDEF)-like protein
MILLASSAERGAKGRIHAVLDAFLYRLSVYGVPAAVGVVSLIALSAWDSEYPVDSATELEIRVVAQTEGALEPAAALERLSAVPALRHYDTRLSELPFWFSFTVPAGRAGELVDAHLPSRHALEAACWDAFSLRALGSASRSASAGQMRSVKAGFAIELGSPASAVSVVCRASFAGPARISAVRWPAAELEMSNEQFHRHAGLLEGGMIALSIFVLLTAIVNREWMYVLFAAWLVASLRLAAISAGWDTQWLEHTVPQAWLMPMKKLTIAALYVLTYMLFIRLCRDDLKKVGHGRLLRVALWSCVLLLAAALALPFGAFLPFMWLNAAVGISILVFLVARILLVTRSRVAMWYGVSLAIVLLTGLYEIVAAAAGFKALIGTVNSVTAALASSLMAALAIAEQIREEHQERMKAQDELASTYEAIPIGLFTLDREGLFVRVNPALTRMLNVDPSRERRGHWAEHFEAGAWRRLQEVAREGAAQEMEVRGVGLDGRDSRRFLAKAILSADKVEGSLQDITEKYEATERLRFLADHDSLTGALNRRGIGHVLEEAAKGLADGKLLALAYLDLDGFKLINDLFGHIAGDEVLRQVCERVEQALAGRHHIGRIGGDEFVIVFQDVPMLAAADLCRRIITSIDTHHYQTADKALQVKGTIGLIELAEGLQVKDAISMADRACRAACKPNADGLVIYERQSNEFRDYERELRLVKHLGVGVAPDGLFLVMQPIMSLSAPYESHDFEVLVRMREADNSVTGAGTIIAAAENNGRAAVIDRWVLSHTLEWLDRHHDALRRTRFVCINLSGASLNDKKFIQDAYSMLAQHPRAAERLCLEITESVALHDLDNTRRIIDTVRGFGAKVALDDFGAGYTSFSYLMELPVDAVKIDGSFITGVATHPANLAVVEAIVQLARNLGMKSIAEWTEDCATIEALAEVGIDYVQGYAVARPQDAVKILSVTSAADFIEDPAIARFVRDSLAAGRTLGLWDQFEDATQLRPN